MDARTSRLIWGCWIFLGGGLVVLFLAVGLLALVLHDKRNSADSKKQAQSPEEKTVAATSASDADSELLRMDATDSTKPAPPPSGEVDRVLGHGMTPPHQDDSLLTKEAPPPLPPPAPEPSPHPKPSTDTAKPANPPPQPAVKPTTAEAETAFTKRLQASEEDLRTQLAAIPELRLFSDLEIQTFRQAEQKESTNVSSRGRAGLDYSFNVRLNRAMRQAALQAGLPIMAGPGCQLDPSAATIVQTLSKDLRDMGFVSVPGTPVRVRFASGRVANVGGTTIATGSPNEKLDAFKEWCDKNRVEKFRGALATLLQMLQVEDTPTRLFLVRELSKIQGGGATAALAKRALADLSPEVRQAALDYLQKRSAAEYGMIFLHALRHPWPPIADHAAVALRMLKPQGVVPNLVKLLDQPDPSVPVLDAKTNKPLVRELVRLNHMRNCLLCHAPSANTNDGLVRGLVPTPGQPLPRLYYAGQSGNFVRADITFLRQDFSVNLPAPDAVRWPKEQRFDFVTRTRPAKPEEMREITQAPGNYPQRDAVLATLRGLTGKDAGASSTAWRTMLGIAQEKSALETKPGPAHDVAKPDTPGSNAKESASEGKSKARQP